MGWFDRGHTQLPRGARAAALAACLGVSCASTSQLHLVGQSPVGAQSVFVVCTQKSALEGELTSAAVSALLDGPQLAQHFAYVAATPSDGTSVTWVVDEEDGLEHTTFAELEADGTRLVFDLKTDLTAHPELAIAVILNQGAVWTRCFALGASDFLEESTLHVLVTNGSAQLRTD
jgi:hypothetical protein